MKGEIIMLPDIVPTTLDGIIPMKANVLYVKPNAIKGVIIKESAAIVDKFDVLVTIDGSTFFAVEYNLSKDLANQKAKDLLEKGEYEFY